MGRLGPEVIEYLRGYALANEFLDARRIEDLGQMRPEESRTIFDQLCELWNQSGSKAGGNLDALDELRLQSLLAQRRAFGLYAKARELM